MKATFTTTVAQAEGKNATGLRVPAEAIAALSKQRKFDSGVVGLHYETKRDQGE